MNSANYRGRIAPTPSGFLHLGHLQTFSIAMQRAKDNCGTLLLRIEDIDRERSKLEYINSILSDLNKAGIICDEGFNIGGNFAPYIQSKRLSIYREILKELILKKFVYPCFESRKSIAKNSAISNYDKSEIVFDESLRNARYEMGTIPDNFESLNWRFKLNYGEKFDFFDELEGKQSFVAGKDFGDFLIWRKNNAPSYELAVVCDDHLMQISEVVRGKDLLLSTPKQIEIYNALNWSIPKFAHCPLVLDENGKKLSKSVLKANDRRILRNC